MRIKKDDIPKTTFCTIYGHHEFVVKPFGPWLIIHSMHAGEEILKLWSNKDVVFLSGGECDTLDLALKRIDRLLLSTRCIFFSRDPIC